MEDKRVNICKDVVLILCTILVLYFIISAIIPVIPELAIAGNPIDISFTATKITPEGAIAETMPITIKGELLTYSSSQRLKVDISSFDGFTDFVPQGKNGDKVKEVELRDCRMVTYYATKENRTYYVVLYFNETMDYWMLIVNGWDLFAENKDGLGESYHYAYYAGSTDESATVEDICKYFNMEDILTPPENSAEDLDLSLHATWVNQDGSLKQIGSVAVKGELPSSLDKAHPAGAEFDIMWPDGLDYLSSAYTCSIYNLASKNSIEEILWCLGFVYSPSVNEQFVLNFYILDKECIVFTFGNAPGEYLVATVDPDADVLQWLDIYKELLAS